MSRFIVVVRESTLQDGKLNIPEKFVSRNGIRLKELIVLKVGNSGRYWEMKLEKEDDGKVWLCQGWKDFEDHYSIQHGNFLLFKYQGNYNFKVIIFNKTATEIAYPTKSKSYRPTANDHDETDSDSGSVQILDVPNTKKAKPTKGGKIKSTKRFKHAVDMDTDQKATAIQRAEVFKSKNPFFWISLPTTYVVQRYMNIPKKFFENHLGDKSTNVILKNSKGGTWLVQYVFKIVKKKPIGKFCTGWNKFVRDNNVQVGDVCHFELIKGHQISFRVRIFPTP
ncbi:hypothetical protein FEM48_Zijuj08G0155800 [Ziziphus jujuba var. spinosa]|uniref:TF-B3 domain-containing protein n=1 Tax=Ziziphus jujuba var. spinosa TaxID=714518 RepID=A0A978UZY4_ZIZJJ|nr:hypothetical protein FEM48_Zijuj08G0155800 [Ziziphus jujuba var. spinosa]